MGDENTNLLAFKNGLRIVTRHVPNYPKIDIRVLINAGSRDEAIGNHKPGTAHFVEHMLSKGSRGFPLPSEATRVILRMGGHYNASTDFDAIHLKADIPKRAVTRESGTNLDAALKSIGSMVVYPLFPHQPRIGETRRIQNEWLEGVMDPLRMRFFDAIRVSSGEAAALRPVLGNKVSIGSIQQEDLERFHREKFTAGNVVIAIEGDLKGEKVSERVSEYFDLPSGRRCDFPAPQYTGGDERRAEDLPGTRVMMGFSMPPRKESVISAPHVMLAKLLNGSSDDSLFQKMSVDEGLVYSVDALRRPFSDYGLFTVGFQSFADAVPRNIELIALQIRRLSTTISAEDFETQRLSDRLESETKMREQTIGAGELADQIAIYNRVLPRDYFFKMEQAVTVPEVKEAAAQLLKRPTTFVASGDLQGIQSPDEIRSLFAAPTATTSPLSLPQPDMPGHHRREQPSQGPLAQAVNLRP